LSVLAVMKTGTGVDTAVEAEALLFDVLDSALDVATFAVTVSAGAVNGQIVAAVMANAADSPTAIDGFEQEMVPPAPTRGFVQLHPAGTTIEMNPVCAANVCVTTTADAAAEPAFAVVNV
jgi:hypothetical protein